MPNQKILVITNMYPGKRNKTFGIFVKNQVTSLRARQFDVDVAAVKDPRVGKKYVAWKYLKWILRMVLLLITKGRKYDVIHAHYVFPSGWFGRLLKKITGAKLVVTAHGGDIDKMPKKSAFIHTQTKHILHDADHIIAVGEGLKQEMIREFKAPESLITVMSMGVNRQVFFPVDKNQAKQNLDLEESHTHLLFVGNIIEAKGLLELVTAFGQLKMNNDKLNLHIVGQPKQESFLNELKTILRKDNIKDVHFHGTLPQNEVAKWMSAADIFVLPSYIEGFGLVAVEAMSCRTPVVGTDVGGLSHLLKDNHGILVKPKNTSSLREGIQRLLEDPSLQKKLIENGEHQAQENDQDVLINLLCKVYEKIGAKK
ncbi:glycosyltransferase [Halobacillus seohaensis]|uniref:Glycosyltransferase n=1 Tax=Halobacillus seohaensis TaxID=447421 RepID=A0ABW2EQ52_9BACI